MGGWEDSFAICISVAAAKESVMARRACKNTFELTFGFIVKISKVRDVSRRLSRSIKALEFPAESESDVRVVLALLAVVCPDDRSTEEAEAAEALPSEGGRDKFVLSGCMEVLLDVEE